MPRAQDKCLRKGSWRQLVAEGVIELKLYAALRGLTFDRAFIIADELQNASKSQVGLEHAHAKHPCA